MVEASCKAKEGEQVGNGRRAIEHYPRSCDIARGSSAECAVEGPRSAPKKGATFLFYGDGALSPPSKFPALFCFASHFDLSFAYMLVRLRNAVLITSNSTLESEEENLKTYLSVAVADLIAV